MMNRLSESCCAPVSVGPAPMCPGLCLLAGPGLGLIGSPSNKNLLNGVGISKISGKKLFRKFMLSSLPQNDLVTKSETFSVLNPG